MTRSHDRHIDTGPDRSWSGEIPMRDRSGPNRRVAMQDSAERRYREPPAPAPEPIPGPPPVNPYAVIALVAALLVVFPVAIVFGFIAFSRRGGRIIAFWALLLGIMEVGTLLALFAVTNHTFSVAVLEHKLNPTTSVATLGQETTSSVPTTTHSAATMAPLPPPPATEPGAKPVLGGACEVSQAGHFGIAVDGRQVLCHTVQGVYQWDKVGTLARNPHESGSSCDPSTDSSLTGKTAAGLAVVCVSTDSTSTDSHTGTWQFLPETPTN